MVGAKQNTSDLSVNALALNGGLITDAAGNKADVSGAKANPAGILQIDGDSPVLSIKSLDANKDEGNVGSTPFTFEITRDKNSIGTTTVDWAVAPTSGVTADGGDFIADAFPTGTVTFSAGELSKIITVNVHGDTFYESNGESENFVVTLSNPSMGPR